MSGMGVTTDETGRVSELSLSLNGLNGEIPRELGELTNLKTLALSVNYLSGELPAELGNLSNLEEIYLLANNLSGEIPREFGNLNSLRVLSLANNLLSGPIPPELGRLPNLNVLSVFSGRNQFTGCIPSGFSDIRSNDFDQTDLPLCEFDSELIALDRENLVALYLATGGQNWKDNSFWLTDEPVYRWYGVTTNGIGRVVNLGLPDNGLIGQIPSDIVNLSELVGLDLSGNRLSGRFRLNLACFLN